MSRISRLDHSEVAPEIATLYDKAFSARGNVPNMFRVMAHRPEIFATMQAHFGGQDRAVLCFGPSMITLPCHHMSHLMAGGQGRWVIRAKYPCPGGEDVAVFGLGRSVVSGGGDLLSYLLPRI